MNKENIPTCKYWLETIDDSIDPEFYSICKLYDCEIEDYYICDSFQKSKRDFNNE